MISSAAVRSTSVSSEIQLMPDGVRFIEKQLLAVLKTNYQ
jgi:hypothetical protein